MSRVDDDTAMRVCELQVVGGWLFQEQEAWGRADRLGAVGVLLLDTHTFTDTIGIDHGPWLVRHHHMEASSISCGHVNTHRRADRYPC